MFTQKSEDIFNFTIQFKNDIIFTESREVIYSLVYALINNIDIIGELNKTNNLSEIQIFNAGVLYNTLSISKQIQQVSEEQLYKIATSFRACVSKNKTFSALVAKFTDPVQLLIYFTKYLYIPVRIDFNTIPENLRIVHLKQYLTTLISLYSNNYVDKFLPIMPTLDKYKQCWDQINQADIGSKIYARMKDMSYDIIRSYCLLKPKEDKPTHCFLYGIYQLTLNMSIEIIKKFCPNYHQVKAINPKYDGTWISPIDDDVNCQIQQLTQTLD
jgi:hypothetical protein